MIGLMMKLVRCFFLGDVAFGEFGLQLLSWCFLYYSYRNRSLYQDFFSHFLFFKVVCIRSNIMVLCCAEVWCNWYLHDINI
jgi:hypothetical protein